MAITITDSALLRLLQLSSAALPVGGFAFSSGLETAVDRGWVRDEPDTRAWLEQQLLYSLARVDVPLLLRQWRAARAGEIDSLRYHNAYGLACRESAELRLTDTAMGEALSRLLQRLDVPLPLPVGEASFLTAYACAASHWGIEATVAGTGYLWSWLENQVAAATKLVPLGQFAAQRLLSSLLPLVEEALAGGAGLGDEEIGGSLPALAMASSWHETQYTRLFRS